MWRRDDFTGLLKKAGMHSRLLGNKFKSSLTNRRNLGLLLLTGIAIFSVIVFMTMLHLGSFGEIPTEKEIRMINNPTSSEIYDDSDVLIGKYFIENRTNASWDDVAPVVFDALVAIEDERFYEHAGVDYKSMFRVLFKTLLGGEEASGGGSTITQQLAKNIYGRPNKGWIGLPLNKMREMVIARKIEEIYSKKEILTLYINTVSWGSNIFGIRVASRKYFSKSAANLNCEEAATLVGMLKATTSYNPLKYTEKAISRRNTVLRRMERNSFLTTAQADSISKLPIVVKPTIDNHVEGNAAYFREFVRLQIDSLLANFRRDDGTPYNVYTDGLKIYTTINLDMQQIAEKAVEDHMAYIQKEFNHVWKGSKPWKKDDYIIGIITRTERYKKMKIAGYTEEAIQESFLTPVEMVIWDWKGERKVTISPLDSIKHYSALYRAGLISAEPSSGYIKAWVGGINYKFIKYDHVTSLRQVGSTFKPIVYTQALKHGFKPCDYLSNEVRTYRNWNDWTPTNIDGRSGGHYTMAAALAKSMNVITANLAIESNLDSVALLAKQLGLTGYVPPYPAISLGAVDASLYDMVQVFSTFANRGTKKPLVYIRRIENKFGEVLIDNETKPQEGKAILTTDEADIITKLLENVVNHGTASSIRKVYVMEGEIAGKTGTSQNEADGWFIGYTPDLCTGVWVGGEAPIINFRYGSLGQGAASALPIWVKYHYKVWITPKLKAYKKNKFHEVSDTLNQLLSCAVSYKKDTEMSYDSLLYDEEDYELLSNDSNMPISPPFIKKDSIKIKGKDSTVVRTKKTILDSAVIGNIVPNSDKR